MAALPGSAGMSDSVYQSLLANRIIFLGSEVKDENANAICAQMLLLNADGTFVESDEVVEVAEEATEEAVTPKRKKAPAPSFDEAAAATKAKKGKADDAE